MPAYEAIVAVLAGGRGSRLGGGKACALLAGRPLIARPLEAAATAGLDAVVVAKPSTPLPALRARVLFEPELPLHPLCGFVRALEHAASLDEAEPPAVVIVACDMPFVTPGLLRELARPAGAAMATLDARLQPALCRCECSHLPALRAALADELPLHEALAALSPRLLDERELSRFGEPRRLCFNVNSPADLSLAESWLD